MEWTVSQDFTSVEEALHSLFGSSVRIAETRRIHGGDINEAYGLTLTDGNRIFMKTNTKDNVAFFKAEVIGLAAIAKTKVIGTPHILGNGIDDSGLDCSFLLMEFIDGKSRVANYWETLAHQLADMHKAPAEGFVDGGKYGFVSNNYIGAGKQINTAKDSWTAFFRDCRLSPQLERAAAYFDGAASKKILRLLDNLDKILVEPEKPSLLHGDLWSGNVITGNDGRAWLIDPAVYVGNAEADIAMTELFGGFPREFYDAYKKVGLLAPGYNKRRDMYNLYHLLNHLNIFGRTYLSSVCRIVDEYV